METTSSGTSPQFKSVDEKLEEARIALQKSDADLKMIEQAIAPMEEKKKAALFVWSAAYDRVRALELMKKEFTQ